MLNVVNNCKEIERPNWEGENAGYTSKHDWLYLKFGQPSICEDCGNKTAKKYEWANVSGKYKRERSDWKRLCTSCHHKFDNSAQKAWITKYGIKPRECIREDCKIMTVSKYQLCKRHYKTEWNKKKAGRKSLMEVRL